jgi:hypothetical protein
MEEDSPQVVKDIEVAQPPPRPSIPYSDKFDKTYDSSEFDAAPELPGMIFGMHFGQQKLNELKPASSPMMSEQSVGKI